MSPGGNIRCPIIIRHPPGRSFPVNEIRATHLYVSIMVGSCQRDSRNARYTILFLVSVDSREIGSSYKMRTYVAGARAVDPRDLPRDAVKNL